jgi:hypothetical protein
MSKLLEVLFGCCIHDQYSFPMDVRPGQRHPEAAGMTGEYVVCLDCSKEFAYCWDEMRVIFASPVSAAVTGSSAASTWEQYGAAELQLVERM